MKSKLLAIVNLFLVAAIPLDLSEWPICADPVLSRQTVETSETQGAQVYQENISGKVYLKQADFPDFSLFEKISRAALPALLPGHFQDENNPGSLNIPAGSVPIKIKHYIEGQSLAEKNDPNKTVSLTKTDAALVPFLAENSALAAEFGPGQGTKSLNFVLPEITPQIPPEETACAPEEKTLSQNLPSPDNPDPNFTATGLIRRIVETIGNIVRTITKKEVKIHSRGYLYGGKTLNEKSEALNSFLPAEFTPQKETSSGQNSLYEVAFSPGEEISTTLKYQGQKAVLERYCNLLRGGHPAAFSVPGCD